MELIQFIVPRSLYPIISMIVKLFTIYSVEVKVTQRHLLINIEAKHQMIIYFLVYSYLYNIGSLFHHSVVNVMFKTQQREEGGFKNCTCSKSILNNRFSNDRFIF